MTSVGQRARGHGATYEHLVGAYGELHVCVREPHGSTRGAVCACVSSMDPYVKPKCTHESLYGTLLKYTVEIKGQGMLPCGS